MLKPDGGYRLYLERGNGAPTPGYRTCDFDASFANATAQTPVSATVPMRNGKPIAARGTMSFSAWQTQKLGALPVADRAPDADPDGDGLTNLVECALDTDPLAPTARRPALFTRADAGGTRFGLRYQRLRQFSDVLAGVESAATPGAWSSAGSPESVALMTDGTERVQVRAAAFVESTPSAFLRVHITLAP